MSNVIHLKHSEMKIIIPKCIDQNAYLLLCEEELQVKLKNIVFKLKQIKSIKSKDFLSEHIATMLHSGTNPFIMIDTKKEI